jgi:hypothetical protein
MRKPVKHFPIHSGHRMSTKGWLKAPLPTPMTIPGYRSSDVRRRKRTHPRERNSSASASGGEAQRIACNAWSADETALQSVHTTFAHATAQAIELKRVSIQSIIGATDDFISL